MKRISGFHQFEEIESKANNQQFDHVESVANNFIEKNDILNFSERNTRILIMETYDKELRSYKNSYLACFLMINLASKIFGKNGLVKALESVAKERLLHDKYNRRIPLLEIHNRVLKPLTIQYQLNSDEQDILFFAIKLSYEYPGIVGSPLEPLSLKKKLPEGFQPFLPMDQILESQRNAGPDGLNTSYMVSQMKGGMSVDFGIGCPLMCAYCYRREGDTVDNYLGSWKPTGFKEAEEAVARLLAHPWFTPHITPIGLHMSTTEAFLPQIWPRTIQALRMLDDLGLTNRVSCITKYFLNDEQIKELESLKNIDLDINCCYSEMPESIEPASRAKRKDFLKRIMKSEKIRAIAYFRPLAEGLNTSEESIRSVWNVYKEAGVKVVSFGGLKFSDDHKKSFMEYGLPLPQGSFTIGNKMLSRETEERILRIFEDVYADVEPQKRPSILRRSSCSRIVARGGYYADYNAHWDLPEKNCTQRCPIQQHNVCFNAIMPTEDEVNNLLERIERSDLTYKITPDEVILFGEISMFERTFLKQNLLFPVLTPKQFLKVLVKDNRAFMEDQPNLSFGNQGAVFVRAKHPLLRKSPFFEREIPLELHRQAALQFAASTSDLKIIKGLVELKYLPFYNQILDELESRQDLPLKAMGYVLGAKLSKEEILKGVVDNELATTT
ncbi:hypothetical protein JYA63_07245 [Fictibacillus nanhaiensis]|uniref:Radical SAM core domain-containing protein n=1 Tax=Fictibacillus nanhaiensis TaxID=742169 RepID=A0ABS2ZMF3_9BACL|nr:hypothetical protein [Fictibacillus nanhaiensis]